MDQHYTIIIISILFSAFFAGTEIAFISSNKLLIELKSKQGSVTANILSNFVNNPSKFISTTLVGNNIGLVIYGISMAEVLDPILTQLAPYLETNVKELPQEILQLVGFLLFINREGVIYIFDYPYDSISIHNRKRMWNIMKEFCRKQNKIGIVAEKDKRTGCTYTIKKISNDEYFGMMI